MGYSEWGSFAFNRMLMLRVGSSLFFKKMLAYYIFYIMTNINYIPPPPFEGTFVY